MLTHFETLQGLYVCALSKLKIGSILVIHDKENLPPGGTVGDPAQPGLISLSFCLSLICDMVPFVFVELSHMAISYHSTLPCC